MRFSAMLLTGLWIAGSATAIILPHAALAQSALAQDGDKLRIGIVAPQSGPYALLGEQVRRGAEAAHNPDTTKLQFYNESCSPAEDAATAAAIREAKLQIVIGYLCGETLKDVAPVLNRDQIAILSLGSQQPGLLEQQARQNFGIFRLMPDRHAAISVFSEMVAPLWRNAPFAVVEDGTIQGRDFAQAALAALKARGLQPVFTDIYRPGQTSQSALVARLKRSGATKLLLGGDGVDAAIISKNAAAAGFDLTIAGGPALLQADPANPLPQGLLMVNIPEAASLPTAQNAKAAIEQDQQALPVEGYAIPAYAAIQIAMAAADQARQQQKPLINIIAQSQFETALGPIKFDNAGQREDNPYRLLRFNGQSFETAAAGAGNP